MARRAVSPLPLRIVSISSYYHFHSLLTLGFLSLRCLTAARREPEPRPPPRRDAYRHKSPRDDQIRYKEGEEGGIFPASSAFRYDTPRGEQAPVQHDQAESRGRWVLESLGVDVIEGGFAIAVPEIRFGTGDRAHRARAIIASLSVRSNSTSYRFVGCTARREGRASVFIATSPIHMK
jgi:hypothetical protein